MICAPSKCAIWEWFRFLNRVTLVSGPVFVLCKVYPHRFRWVFCKCGYILRPRGMFQRKSMGSYRFDYTWMNVYLNMDIGINDGRVKISHSVNVAKHDYNNNIESHTANKRKTFVTKPNSNVNQLIHISIYYSSHRFFVSFGSFVFLAVSFSLMVLFWLTNNVAGVFLVEFH